MPASGPVSRRSSPIRRLIRVDLPALGRPTMASRSGRSRGDLLGLLIALRRIRPPSVASRHRARRSAVRAPRRVAQALAMLGRERMRLAEPELIGLEAARLAGRPSALLARGSPACPLRRRSRRSSGRSASRRPAHRSRRGRHRRRRWPLGLRAHAAFEAPAVPSSSPAVSSMRKLEVAKPRLALAAVAGDARRVVDQRQPPADQPVEQRRLADIGPAGNNNHGCHVGQLSAARSTSLHPRAGKSFRWR